MSDEELNEFVMAQFMRYDADQNGYLDRNEFKAVLADAELGLTKKEARRVMQEADENDDGVLEYREFVPVMVEIIHGLQARARACKPWMISTITGTNSRYSSTPSSFSSASCITRLASFLVKPSSASAKTALNSFLSRYPFWSAS